eukprot:CAMPEP_0116923030 /NCGR_PEP_ID=MMETSP0467-20121206/22623_1 /TAXON_ID=283647 /ORGANISM="Mesodinium pulex, Strain SPMC105" /LENGTH=55 /DNA_ID=CAMNT_0004601491 /DNA_START=53 /DNA_END=216 /DNA_ORIENTATION=-
MARSAVTAAALALCANSVEAFVAPSAPATHQQLRVTAQQAGAAPAAEGKAASGLA